MNKNNLNANECNFLLKNIKINKENKEKKHFNSFENLNKLQDNNEVMAFLYGHLDHFILDLTVHPLIYYMTGDKEQEFKFNYHALVEMWMDDYVMKKHHIDEKQYYHKFLSTKPYPNLYPNLKY